MADCAQRLSGIAQPHAPIFVPVEIGKKTGDELTGLFTFNFAKQAPMPKATEIIIGELFPQPAAGNRVFASVYASQNVQGEMTVTDENGQVRISTAFDLEKEGDTLELDISDLPSGEYRVRIDMLGEQWERRMWIEGK